MVANYGLVVIPMYDFYPPDARSRNANAGYDQLRISFCFSESRGEQRRKDLDGGRRDLLPRGKSRCRSVRSEE